jgi:hypothetical protein
MQEPPLFDLTRQAARAYRPAQKLARQEVPLDRATLASWVVTGGRDRAGGASPQRVPVSSVSGPEVP